MLVLRTLIICLLLFIRLPSSAADEDPKPSTFGPTELEETIPEEDASSLQMSKDSSSFLPEAESAEATIPLDIPVYEPPMRGAPAGRIAGGTRGEAHELPRLYVLAPDHAGLTIQEQPCLYWFLSKPTSHRIELTIIEIDAITPLLQTTVPSPKQSSIQSVPLSSYDVHLKAGTRYKWFVSLVDDDALNSRAIIAGAVIERIRMTKELGDKLNAARHGRACHVYAEQGIWYDALESISRLIESNPDRAVFRRQRASLLEQAGLSEVADYERTGLGR